MNNLSRGTHRELEKRLICLAGACSAADTSHRQTVVIRCSCYPIHAATWPLGPYVGSGHNQHACRRERGMGDKQTIINIQQPSVIWFSIRRLDLQIKRV